MNKPFYILLFVLAWGFSKAQTNLIYNGDFELYDTCPTLPSSPSDYQIETCLGWKAPTYATSDYFNFCAPATSIGVPKMDLDIKSLIRVMLIVAVLYSIMLNRQIQWIMDGGSNISNHD